MWPTLFLGLLVASLAGWGITTYLQSRRIRRLERSHEEIQVEETLVFDFLHGLGEAFRGTIRPQELHRLIVEGAVRILDAHGGALYVADRTGGKLMPHSSRRAVRRWWMFRKIFCNKRLPILSLLRLFCGSTQLGRTKD